MLGTVFLRDLRARVRVKSYEKYVYLGFPWEFEGRRGIIRRPYAPSRMPYRSHGHPRNFDIFDIFGGCTVCTDITLIHEGSKAKTNNIAQQKLFKLFQCLREAKSEIYSIVLIIL